MIYNMVVRGGLDPAELMVVWIMHCRDRFLSECCFCIWASSQVHGFTCSLCLGNWLLMEKFVCGRHDFFVLKFFFSQLCAPLQHS